MTTLQEWFAARIPEGWVGGAIEVVADRDEILVIGPLGVVDPRVFREASRDERVAIAQAAEANFDRKVSWAVRVDDEVARFTSLSVPVMSRLRVEERHVLDELIAGGIARSRSEALAWCVRFVGANEGEWLAELREAAQQLAEVRGRGPDC
jgi:hypothetical protein